MANLRTTGVHGFRPACVQEQDLQAQGWKAYWASRHVHYSPHMQSWLWACHLWAYQQTRFPPLLERSRQGMRLSMLIQTDGDPVCDLLYACNFALIGLHEAAAATGDAFYAEAEDRLARFLCRIQVRSAAHSELDGAWYRAFDFRRWDYWASSADWEWGPWCTETGWCQPWIAGTLALRSQKTSLWDLVQKVDLQTHFERLRPSMLPDDVLEDRSLEPAAKGP